MKCPHCRVEFHESWWVAPIHGIGPLGVPETILAGAFGEGREWFKRAMHCPKCKKLVLELFVRDRKSGADSEYIRVFPVTDAQEPIHESVPNELKKDYIEACAVLRYSSRGSAALSRRCLQHILRNNGYKSKGLAEEIDLLLSEKDPQKALSYSTRRSVDAIRNFGNFAAHPTEVKASLEIIDVEPEEAEWCLETIRALFEHFYVAPSEADKRRAQLDAKLAKAGKPPAKG